MSAAKPDLPPIPNFRGQRVMLDNDIARLYGIATMVFNQAIKRTMARFPRDFLFQLSPVAADNLKSQIVISNSVSAKGRRLRHGAGARHPGLSPSTAPSWPPRFSAARAPLP
ncbi:MAG: ORF6N domain-containing protein [Opitutaceae bacterium]